MSRFASFAGLLNAALLSGCQTWSPEAGLSLPMPTYAQVPPQYIPADPPFPSRNELPQVERPAPPSPQQPGLPPAIGPVEQAGPPPVIPAPVVLPSHPSVAPAAPAANAARPTTERAYVAELLDVIENTKSVDAFLVTAKLLAAEKPRAAQVVPVLIRNAERLGIYRRFVFEKDAPEAGVVSQFTDLVMEIGKESAASPTATLPPVTPRSQFAGQSISQEAARPSELNSPVETAPQPVNGNRPPQVRATFSASPARCDTCPPTPSVPPARAVRR